MAESDLLKAASITLVGSVVGRGLRYAMNIVIANGLGASALGTFAFALVFMRLGGVFSRFGLDQAAQKFVPIHRSESNQKRLAGTVLACLLIPLVIGIGVSLGIFYIYRKTDIFSGALFTQSTIFLVAGIPFFAVMWVAIAITRGYKKAKYAVYIRDIAHASLAFIGAVVGSLLVADIQAVIFGYIVSLCAAVLIAIVYLRQLGAFKELSSVEIDLPNILTFSAPLLVAAIAQFVIFWSDIMMLGFLSPSADVGRYQAAFQTTALLGLALQSANSVFPSIASELHISNQYKRLRKIYSVTTKWVFYFTLIGGVYLVIFSEEILLIFGSKFASASNVFVVLTVAQFIASAVGPTGYLLTMSGFERLESVNTLCVSFLNIALNYVLIIEYGIFGAAIATGSSMAILNIARLIEVKLYLGMSPYSTRYWKGILTTGLLIPFVIVGSSIRLPNLLQLISVGVATLGLFLIILWLLGLDNEDQILLQTI